MSMVPSGGSALARPEGLEDFDISDQVLPTIRINHTEVCFEDALSNEKYSELDVVVLGLIKQRILWPPDLSEDKASWMCRSYEFKTGYPTRDNTDSAKNFPWEASGFDPNQYPDGALLPCDSCKLKEWDTHPKRNAPWCSAQYTFAVMLLNAEQQFYPSLIQVQRSALKPANSYMSAFANSSTPLFTVFTKLTLESHKKGQNVYGVPKFAKGQATPVEAHALFAENYRAIRTYIQTPWQGGDDEGEVETAVSNPGTAPAPTAAAAPAPAAAPPAPAPVAPAPPQPVSPLGATASAPAAPTAPVPQAATAAPPAPVDDDDVPF